MALTGSTPRAMVGGHLCQRHIDTGTDLTQNASRYRSAAFLPGNLAALRRDVLAWPRVSLGPRRG